MNILIWKCYGEIDVLCAETVRQLESIALEVHDMASDLGIDADKFKSDTDALLEKGSSSEKIINSLKILVKTFIDEHDGHDAFEQFYFDKVMY